MEPQTIDIRVTLTDDPMTDAQYEVAEIVLTEHLTELKWGIKHVEILRNNNGVMLPDSKTRVEGRGRV